MGAKSIQEEDKVVGQLSAQDALVVVKESLGKSNDDTKLLFDRIRLGIITTLAIQSSATFIELTESLQVTDGNLSTHAKKLEEAGLVRISKRFIDKKPRTEFKVTPKGRRSLKRYLDHMESIIQSTQNTSK